jgi:hypothetical protein
MSPAPWVRAAKRRRPADCGEGAYFGRLPSCRWWAARCRRPSTLPDSFQPQPVPSSSNFAPGSSGPKLAMYIGLEELMVVGAHRALAAVEHFELHALELGGDRLRLVRFGFRDGLGEHAHLVDGARIPQAEAGTWRGNRLLELLRIDSGAELLTPSWIAKTRCEVGLLDRGRPAGAAGVIGVPVNLQARVGRRLEQQRDVLNPSCR